MDKPVKSGHNSPFEQAKNINEDGMEFWRARDLQRILDYSDFRNFEAAIKKAIKACENSGHNSLDHFVEVTNMINIGKGAQREVKDYYLSRYACYLIIQNADPTEPMVALGQTYFAIQTRKQEVFEQKSEAAVFWKDDYNKRNVKYAYEYKNGGFYVMDVAGE